MDDESLHVVAAPGSGKTVLGLEVILRLGRPTLAIAPTLTIRDQWVRRMTGLFLPVGHRVPNWVSKDLRRPSLFTVTTYQALHSAATGSRVEEVEEAAEEEASRPSLRSGATTRERPEDLVALLRRYGVQTLILDEAHHLRNEWWKTLVHTVDGLERPTLVALTATPPYDVPLAEWERYIDLCGPIDAEIGVPELVQAGDLCPHQDLVYMSSPTRRETASIRRFREDVDAFVQTLTQDHIFVESLQQHPWVQDPYQHAEEVLSNPAYLSSVAVFLRLVGRRQPDNLLEVLGVRSRRLPRANLEWLETLLTGTLYSAAAEHFPETVRAGVETRLRRIGAIERRQVMLRDTRRLRKLLETSLSKLESIVEIVRLERDGMGEALRLVVLTDFIRKAELPRSAAEARPFTRIGVVPIFESLRRELGEEIRLGILSGTLVVVPAEAASRLRQVARNLGHDDTKLRVRPLRHAKEYVTVSASGRTKDDLVVLVTRLFREGEIQALVGTKALLGEGWDAPSMNTLVLASFVGAYMLSNQMRGRAFRIQPGNPRKVSNIWHPICVELGRQGPGADYEGLSRRFRAFVGVSLRASVIENGLQRLGLGGPSFTRERISASNDKMRALATDREGQWIAWERALEGGTRLVEEVRTPRPSLPRPFVFKNTIEALLREGLFVGGSLWAWYMREFFRAISGEPGVNAIYVLVAALLMAAILVLPRTLKAVWLLLRHGPIASSLKEVGEALLRTLGHIEVLRTSVRKLAPKAEKARDGTVVCQLSGGTSYEKSVFLDSLRELLDPIGNPRYLLMRHSRLGPLLRKDFLAVPGIIGKRKEHARYFAKMWSKYVGDADLVYTRNVEGRRLLLRAREHSLSSAFQRRSDRRSVWQ